MKYLIHQKFNNCSLSTWKAMFDSKASVRATFVKGEVNGIVGENEVMTYSEVVDFEAAKAHANEPEIKSHIETIGETTDLYELYEINSNETGGLFFAHFTFENESPEEWISTWKNDSKKLTTNEKYAIVDDNNVLALFESHATERDIENHLNRPEVRDHIDKVNEQFKAWTAVKSPKI